MKNTANLKEFLDNTSDLLAARDIRKLRLYRHHRNTNRLEHSATVAYLSFTVVKRLGGDSRAAARGGLLHDFFLYDPAETYAEGFAHLLAHPGIALENAGRICNPSPLEEEIILSHMFPIGFRIPRSVESVTVCLTDKYCAAGEFLGAPAVPLIAARVSSFMRA